MPMSKEATDYAIKLAYHRGAQLAVQEFEKQSSVLDSPLAQQLRQFASTNRNALIGAGIGGVGGAAAGAAAGGEDHRGLGAGLGALGGAALGAGAGHGYTQAGGMQGIGNALSGAKDSLAARIRGALGGGGPDASVPGIPAISGHTMIGGAGMGGEAMGSGTIAGGAHAPFLGRNG